MRFNAEEDDFVDGVHHYWKIIDATEPEIWPGSTPWSDRWGSFGTTPGAHGFGASVMRTRVPEDALPSFWRDIQQRYPMMLPRFSVGPGDTPGLAAFLQSRGYQREMTETAMVMDRERFDGMETAPAHLVQEVVTSEALRRVLELDNVVFNDPILDQDGLNRELRRLGSSRRLFFIPGPDGTAVAAAGLTHFSEWSLLWGGETHPAFRGRGLYRALLTHRIRVIRESRARFAAVYANNGTSMPIVARCGFVPIGAVEVWQPPGVRSGLPI